LLDRPSEPGKPSVLAALRNATHSLHVSLASNPAMSRLLDKDYSNSEYRAHLGRVLGFFEPLECVASHAAEVEGSVCPLNRSGDVREDLRLMGATTSEIDALERCQRLPSIAPGGLRGYTYVILGSMQGGRIIARQLRAVLGPGASLRFYGDESGRFETAWASFCSDLEANGKDDVEAICTTAIDVFNAYAAWFSEPVSRIGG